MMNVTRVNHGGGSHVEPPFDESWNDLTKLEWATAVSLADAGLPPDAVKVVPTSAGRIIRRWGKEHVQRYAGRYDIAYGPGRGVTCSFGYHEARTYLQGVTLGARLARGLDS